MGIEELDGTRKSREEISQPRKMLGTGHDESQKKMDKKTTFYSTSL